VYKSDKLINVQRERIREKLKAMLFWYKMGRIKINYARGKVTILNGLTDIETEKIRNKIVKRINKTN